MNLIPEAKSHLYYSRLTQIHRQASDNYLAASVQLRQLLEEIFLDLTSSEKQVFENLFARMNFCESKFSFTKDLIDSMHSARTRLNKIMHLASKNPSRKDYLYVFTCIATLVQELGETVIIPEAIGLVIHEAQVKLTFWTSKLNPDAEIELRVTFLKILPLPKDANPELELHIEVSHEEHGPLVIIVQNHQATQTNIYPNNMIAECKKAWPLSTLHFHHLEPVLSEHYNVQVFTTNIKSLAVLEPDFLIDASQLADGLLDRPKPSDTEKPLQYFARRLVQGNISSALVIGNLVNYAFDAILAGTPVHELDFESYAKSEQLLHYVTYGEEEIKQMIYQVKSKHLEALIEFAKSIKEQGLIAHSEVSYMSNRYGLQGRLDIQLTIKEDDTRLDIIELKSGKFPQVIQGISQTITFNGETVYPNHESQVNSYELLLESAFFKAQKKRSGTNSVLYSQAGTSQSLRYVNRISHTTQRLMQLRNSIISALYYLAEGSKTAAALQKMLQDTPLLATYLRQAGEILQTLVVYDTHISSSYYLEFLAFQMRELWASKIGSFRNAYREDGGFSDLWLKSTPLKIETFNVIHLLRLYDTESEESLLHFTFPNKLHHCFRKGDYCILYQYFPNETSSDAVMQQQVLKGVIQEISKGKLVFSLKNKQADFQSLLNFEGFYQLEADTSDTSHWNNMQGLLEICKLPYNKRDVLLGLAPSGVTELVHPIPQDILEPLTPIRQTILTNILQAKDYFLLQGPPGTGKTSQMLISIVKATLALNTHQHITILAYTNKAVEEITHKLTKNNIPYIQLGGQDAENPNRISSMAKVQEVNTVKHNLQTMKVIVSTVHTYQSRAGLMDKILTRDLLIIDEASQILDHQAAAIMALFTKSILIGDQNQLPAVVTQATQYTEVKSAKLKDAGFTDLRQSLFERLHKQCEANGWSHSYALLPEHFRMHQDIATLVNHYYDNKLSAHTDRQKAAWHFPNVPNFEAESALLNRSRTIYIDTPVELTPKLNETEAKIAIQLARCYQASSETATVGIVCPWRAQVASVRQLAEEYGLDEDRLTIETVEKFQGMECDYIIVSTAVDSPGRLQAMQSLSENGLVDRKLNVAISRAKEQFVLLGAYDLLIQSTHYADLIRRIDGGGGRV